MIRIVTGLSVQVEKIINSLNIRVLSPAFILFLIITPDNSSGQEYNFRILSADEAVNLALKNNPIIKNKELEIKKSEAAAGSAFDFEPTEFTYQYGQMYSAVNDRYIGISQNFGSLLSHINQLRVYRRMLDLSKTEDQIAKKEMAVKVKSAYYFWVYLHKKLEILDEQKDLYADLTRVADLQYKLGETDLLAKKMSSARQADIELKYNTAFDDLVMAENKLKQLIIIKDDLVPADTELNLYMISKPSPDSAYHGDLLLSLYQENLELKQAELVTAQSGFFPEISAGYFNQDIGNFRGLQGWTVGLTFPLWFLPKRAEVSQAKISRDIADNNLKYQKYLIDNDIENLLFELNKYFKQFHYYNTYVINEADELINTTRLQYNKEEIDYFDYIQGISEGLKLKTDFLETINNYNQTAIQLELYVY